MEVLEHVRSGSNFTQARLKFDPNIHKNHLGASNEMLQEYKSWHFILLNAWKTCVFVYWKLHSSVLQWNLEISSLQLFLSFPSKVKKSFHALKWIRAAYYLEYD